MKQTVLLTQLYKSAEPNYAMATCHINDSEDDDRFECKIKGDKTYKEQLWQYCSGNWKGLTCEIEFTEVNSRGIPTDAVITSVKGFNQVYLNG